MKRASGRKVSAPKIAKFNRLIDDDLIDINDEEGGPVMEYEFLRDEPLQLSTSTAQKSVESLMPTLERQNSASQHELMQSAIVSGSINDFLNVRVSNSKFVALKDNKNERAGYFEMLRLQATGRKMPNLTHNDIFEKSATDLVMAQKPGVGDASTGEDGNANTAALSFEDMRALEEGDDEDFVPGEEEDDEKDYDPCADSEGDG
jgi:hypothetical protein